MNHLLDSLFTFSHQLEKHRQNQAMAGMISHATSAYRVSCRIIKPLNGSADE